MKSNDIKKFFAKLGNKVRVRTGTGKGQWIGVWIPCDKGNIHQLVYSVPPFALDLRVACLKIIYGDDCQFAGSGNAGNVRNYDISMTLPQWERLIASYPTP